MRSLIYFLIYGSCFLSMHIVANDPDGYASHSLAGNRVLLQARNNAFLTDQLPIIDSRLSAVLELSGDHKADIAQSLSEQLCVSLPFLEFSSSSSWALDGSVFFAHVIVHTPESLFLKAAQRAEIALMQCALEALKEENPLSPCIPTHQFLKPLIYTSVPYFRSDFFTLLRVYGFKLNVQDERGKTLLHHAALANNISLAQGLLQQPTLDVLAYDLQGYSAYHYAKSKNYKEMGSIILQVCSIYDKQGRISRNGFVPQGKPLPSEILKEISTYLACYIKRMRW